MQRRLISAAATLFLLTAPAFSDVVLDLRTTNTSATTQPADADSSVSVLAVPGHDFFTKYTAGDHTIEVSGSIQLMANGQFRVKIKFESRSGGLQSIATTLELKAGEAFTLSGVKDGTFARTTVLTVRPSPV